MLTLVLWWVANGLIALLLFRAVRARFASKYPCFYLYLAFVLAVSLLRFYVYVAAPDAYQILWWYTQFLSVGVGYCVIWEIYAQALAPYAGAARMARQLLLVVFVVVVAGFLTDILRGTAWSSAETALERNFRTVQTVLLVAVLGLVSYYGIPIGTNLRGVISGYGFFLATSVINLSLRTHLGDVFQLWWQYLQPMAHLITLFIWSATLWSYQPNPELRREVGLEHDYQLLATGTENVLLRAQRYLMKAVRS